MAHFDLLEVVPVTLEPKKGISISELFINWILDNYADGKDNPDINLPHLSFRVNGQGFPYHQVVEFIRDIPTLKEKGNLGELAIDISTDVSLAPQDIVRNTIRVLRTLEREGAKWHDQEGSLLSHECIIELIKQFHLKAVSSETTIRLLEAKVGQPDSQFGEPDDRPGLLPR